MSHTYKAQGPDEGFSKVREKHFRKSSGNVCLIRYEVNNFQAKRRRPGLAPTRFTVDQPCPLVPFTGGLADLPSKALVRLLPHVPAKETLALEKTCKRFQQLIVENPTITQKFVTKVSVNVGNMSINFNHDVQEAIITRSVSVEIRHFFEESRHSEMDGQLDVVSYFGNTLMVYRQPTRVLPSHVLLDYFIRKILNKVALKTLVFKGADDKDIMFIKQLICPFANADFEKAGITFSEGDGNDKIQEETVHDFVGAFSSLKSILCENMTWPRLTIDFFEAMAPQFDSFSITGDTQIDLKSAEFKVLCGRMKALRLGVCPRLKTDDLRWLLDEMAKGRSPITFAVLARNEAFSDFFAIIVDKKRKDVLWRKVAGKKDVDWRREVRVSDYFDDVQSIVYVVERARRITCETVKRGSYFCLRLVDRGASGDLEEGEEDKCNENFVDSMQDLSINFDKKKYETFSLFDSSGSALFISTDLARPPRPSYKDSYKKSIIVDVPRPSHGDLPKLKLSFRLSDLPIDILVNWFIGCLEPEVLLAFENTSKYFKRLVDENRHLCQKVTKNIEIRGKEFYVYVNHGKTDKCFEIYGAHLDNQTTLGIDVFSGDTRFNTRLVDTRGPPPRLPESLVLEHILNKVLSRITIETLTIKSDGPSLALLTTVLKKKQRPKKAGTTSEQLSSLVVHVHENMPLADALLTFCSGLPAVGSLDLERGFDPSPHKRVIRGLVENQDRKFEVTVSANWNERQEGADAFIAKTIDVDDWELDGDVYVHTLADGHHVECELIEDDGRLPKLVFSPPQPPM